MIFRNHDGAYMGGACHTLPLGRDPERCELLACRRAIHMTYDLQVTKLHIEMDCSYDHKGTLSIIINKLCVDKNATIIVDTFICFQRSCEHLLILLNRNLTCHCRCLCLAGIKSSTQKLQTEIMAIANPS